MSGANNTGSNTSAGKEVELFQLVLYIPIFIVGLVLNSAVLWMLAFKIRKLMESTIYMTNLILADFLLLFTIPFKIYAYSTPKPLNFWFCKFLESLYFVNIYVSILIITAVCVDRYIAIKLIFLAKHLRSPKKAAMICIAIWIIVWLASIHIYIAGREAYNSTFNMTCFHNLPDEVWDLKIIIPVEITFLTCAVIVSFCSIQIIRTLQNSCTESENTLKKKAIKIVLSSLLIFLVCFIPHHVSLLLFTLTANNLMGTQEGKKHFRTSLQVCLIVANVNCCLDAVYYYFSIKELQRRNDTVGERQNMCVEIQETIETAVVCSDLQTN